MAVFPIIKSEDVVQVSDKIRLSAVATFTTQGEFAISKVEIEPEDMAGFTDVFNEDQNEWYLDWSYATDGEKVVTLKVTTVDDTDPMMPVDVETTTTKTITVKTLAEDLLFSSDDNLRAREHDILKWIPDGYSSWNHVHRQAQKNILDWLDEIRLYKVDGSRWLASDVVEKEQVRRISVLTTLRMIFGSISNASDDIFDKKRAEYFKLETEAKNRNYITLDVYGDTTGVKQDLRSMSIVRR